MKKLFAVMVVAALALGFSACGEKTAAQANAERAAREAERAAVVKKRAEERAEEDAKYWKSREICLEGIVYYQPSNGGAPTVKMGPDGIPVKCTK